MQAPEARGQEALERGDWAGARAAFEEALALRPAAETSLGLARAVEWQGDYEAALELYEQAYAQFRAREETRVPALIAGRMISFLYAAVHGNAAAAGGWLERARRLAEAAGDCPERGWVELAAALMTDDPARKRGHADEAARIALRFGDGDLEFAALAYQGTCDVMRGNVSEGMRLLDEAVTAATNGEVKDYLTTGEIYCKMLLCCELVLDVHRARQWMTVAESFAKRSNYLPVSAICRMHYGGILTAAGQWSEAETHLTASARIYDSGYRSLRPGAVVRLADLRVRQGRFSEASLLLAGNERDSYAIGPRARLHLASEEAGVAASILRRHLGRTGEHVLQVPVLALLVEAEAAAGHVDNARAVCARLDDLAAHSPLPHVRALASQAAGLACEAGDERAALRHFETAITAFGDAGLPLEEARARLSVARLVEQSGREVAAAEARRALEIFERLPARPDADAAAQLLRTLGFSGRTGPKRPGTLTVREREVLRHVAEGLSNEQIAKRLYLSKRTVEHHVSSILAKLGLNTRAEAVAFALRPEQSSGGS